MAVGGFELVSDYRPQGDQPAAIKQLVASMRQGQKAQTLLGVTGSGKTFTVASVIQEIQKPALVIAHNKTLAAQLYSEFRELFPKNAIEYFVSYYDYYQPEAYIPRTDTYIEKDASINEQIERMRNSATRSLIERQDVLIVASVSCIYGLGSPDAYEELSVPIQRGATVDRDDLLRQLTSIQYQRNNYEFKRGSFRVRGDVVDIFPAYEEQRSIRVEFFDDEIDTLLVVDPLTGEVFDEPRQVVIYPASHYVTPKERLERAIQAIEEELEHQLLQLKSRAKLLEAQRLEQRTRFDLEILRETGFCPGIENYSRHLDGREPGEPPATLLNYFPEDFAIFIDESHMTVPQIGAMFRGDRSRKETLVDHGFRLPSAVDNRPLRFDEFERLVHQVTFVSATPAEYEREHSGDRIAEQIIRPTGLVDPPVIVRSARGQVDDLYGEILQCVQRGERVLITTLTKRMAEELTEYYRGLGVRVKYLHSDIDTIQRTELLEELRAGRFDVLVGINLLREGLDLPEVALVAILDADKEGFLRSTTSLIQTFGRAARNVDGRVIMYADHETPSMRAAMEETRRRREVQIEYNQKHEITPESVKKALRQILEHEAREELPAVAAVGGAEGQWTPETIRKELKKLRKQMFDAAEQLEFEAAAQIRDQIRELERLELTLR